MTKEEAIEVYNGLINTKIKEAFEFFAPELREGEDERVRKWLYAYMMACPNDSFEFYAGVGKGRVLEWLEKQKEQEQPEVDLEKEIHKKVLELHTAPCYDELVSFARHFYELGQLNARKED